MPSAPSVSWPSQTSLLFTPIPPVPSPCALTKRKISVNFRAISYLPGVASSGTSKEYTGLENLGIWSLTSLTVMFILMSEDCRPSSARTSKEYLERRSRSRRLVAIRSPDSGSMWKLSSAPLIIVYVTRALAP